MNKIELLFSGDFAPLIPITSINDDHFKTISEVLNTADLHITNLECPLTDSQKPIEKTGPAIKVEPRYVSILKQARVNIACLANNHIFDYGEKGITDTIEILKNSGIETTGIVHTPGRIDHWLIKEIKDKKIGFLNYCEHEFSVREKGLLGASGYDPINAYFDIKNLRSQVDWLMVIYHGGNEYYSLPRPELRKDFHYLADLGVDAVIGHHTHVFSGYEIYNGKPLVYSLGNFFFPYEGEPESWHEGILCQLKIENSIEAEFIPVLQCKEGFKVIKMSNEKSKNLLKEMEKYSDIIRNEEKLQRKWNNYVNTIGNGISYQLLYPTKIDKLMLKLPLFKECINNKKRRKMILNILRCKSLEQLLIDNLKS